MTSNACRFRIGYEEAELPDPDYKAFMFSRQRPERFSTYYQSIRDWKVDSWDR